MGRGADSGRIAFWRELIGRRRSGLSVARLCAEAGVSTASFYLWQRKLRGHRARARAATPDRQATSRLIPVRILADAPAGNVAGVLEILLPGEILLRIPSGCDPATLQLVLSMLLPGGGGAEDGSC
jgi:hypothetical protein